MYFDISKSLILNYFKIKTSCIDEKAKHFEANLIIIDKEEHNLIINNLKLDNKYIIKDNEFKEELFSGEKLENDNDKLYHINFLFSFKLMNSNLYYKEYDNEKIRNVSWNIIPVIISTIAINLGFVTK